MVAGPFTLYDQASASLTLAQSPAAPPRRVAASPATAPAIAVPAGPAHLSSEMMTRGTLRCHSLPPARSLHRRAAPPALRETARRPALRPDADRSPARSAQVRQASPPVSLHRPIRAPSP